MNRRHAALVRPLWIGALTLLAGCGIGIHRNSSVAVTAAFHDHQNDIASFRQLTDAAPKGPPGARVSVAPFVRYYPTPVGFTLGSRSGRLTWTEIAPPQAPEVGLQAAFAKAVGSDDSASLQLTAVVTHASWYVLENATGGRVTSLVTLTGRDGKVLFEGERSTTGRATSLDQLYAAHVGEWLAQPEFVRALTAGGAL